jgi:hypothetical protein
VCHYLLVTFKDLQKLVQSQSGPEQSQLLLRLEDKPFWIWDPKQHKQEDIKTKGDCCFNHIIGLPRKDGIEKSIADQYMQKYIDFETDIAEINKTFRPIWGFTYKIVSGEEKEMNHQYRLSKLRTRQWQ